MRKSRMLAAVAMAMAWLLAAAVAARAEDASVCVSDAECDDGLACTDDWCDNGVCVRADGCPEGEQCDPDTGECVPFPPGDFTIIALPDAQYYARDYPAIYGVQTQWVVENHEPMEVAFVTQLGDAVQTGDNGGNPVEWLVADAAFSLLEDPVATMREDGIPYGIAVGNHDQSPGRNAGTLADQGATTTSYNHYFGTSRFVGRSYYGSHFGTNNDNHYELFSAGGMHFVILHLEYEQEDSPLRQAVLAWAGDVLETYSDRRAILSAHYLMNPGDSGSFDNQGAATYEALKHHPNLFLMLCGHRHGEGKRVDTFNGSTIYTLLADYQKLDNGGNGWLRILRFSPANNEIKVRTYSPWTEQYDTTPDSDFTLPYDMSVPCPGDGSDDPKVLFVDAAAEGLETGASWADAFTDLQSALDAVEPGCGAGTEIWVAAGTYRPSRLSDGDDARSATFRLKSGVRIHGGFSGVETARHQRDPVASLTILSGDLSGDDQTGGDNSENSYHVLLGSAGDDASTVLDGLTVTGGNADGAGVTARGGALYLYGGSPVLVDCVFAGNSASERGAAICTIEGSPAVTNCLFVGNRCDGHGGGIYNQSGTPTIAGCTFGGNFAAGNCELVGGCQGGAGVYGSGDGDATITNCVLWGNRDDNGEVEYAQVYRSGVTVTYSCIQGMRRVTGEGNIKDDPLYVQAPDDGGDGWGVGGNDDYGDLRLQADSPCIDAGNGAAVPPDVTDLDDDSNTAEPLPLDLHRNPRCQDDPVVSDTGIPSPSGPVVDMGAFEAPGLPNLATVVGADPDDSSALIWPKADDVGLAEFDIDVDQPVTYVGSSVGTTEGGADPIVTGVTRLGRGIHRVTLSHAIPVGQWTTISLTVAGATGIEGTFELWLGHLPGDVNADGQVTMSDATAFGQLFGTEAGNPDRDRIDLNNDGQANLVDATVLGQLWNGTSGHQAWREEALPARPQ